MTDTSANEGQNASIPYYLSHFAQFRRAVIGYDVPLVQGPVVHLAIPVLSVAFLVLLSMRYRSSRRARSVINGSMTVQEASKVIVTKILVHPIKVQ